MDNTENVIEFITGEHNVTVTFTSRKEINRVKKIYETRSSEFKFLIENADGSVCAKFPKKWIKINPGSNPNSSKPKRTRTPEQIEAAKQALAKWRMENKKTN